MFPSTNFQILPTSLPTQTHTLSPRKITHKIKIKTNKKTVRWKNAKTKQKVHKKTYGVHFGFSNSFWALKLPWSVVDIPSNTLLGGKTDFSPFTSRYQLAIASWLGMRLCIHVPFSVWEFCLAWICLVGMASRYEFICVSLLLCLEDTAGSHPPFKGFTILAQQSLFLYYIVFLVESRNLSKCWLEVDPGCSALNRTL